MDSARKPGEGPAAIKKGEQSLSPKLEALAQGALSPKQEALAQGQQASLLPSWEET
jgi:hypothetical protein